MAGRLVLGEISARSRLSLGSPSARPSLGYPSATPRLPLGYPSATPRQVASSDEERARGGSFDETLSRVLRSAPAVCYDKNLPDANGLSKLCRVLRAAETRHGVRVRVLLVAPRSLRHDVMWARVGARAATDHALTQHIEGGAAKAYEIFNAVFFEPSRKALSSVHRLPGVLVSDAFWAEGAEGPKELAEELVRRATAGDAPTLAEFAAAVAGGGGGGGGGGGASAAAPTASYMMAELPGTQMHVTLVPPRGSATSAAEAAALFAAMRALQPLAGSPVRVVLPLLGSFFSEPSRGTF